MVTKRRTYAFWKDLKKDYWQESKNFLILNPFKNLVATELERLEKMGWELISHACDEQGHVYHFRRLR